MCVGCFGYECIEGKRLKALSQMMLSRQIKKNRYNRVLFEEEKTEN